MTARIGTLYDDWLKVSDTAFFLRVHEDSMADGIRGDLVLVEPCLTPESGDLVVTVVDGQSAVRRYAGASDLEVKGRVTALIRKYGDAGRAGR